MEPALVKKERMVIVGLRQHVLPQGNEIPELYGKWAERSVEVEMAVSDRTFGIEMAPLSGAAKENGIEFLVGAEVLAEAPIPDGMTSFAADAGYYAVFTYKGTLVYIRTFIDSIYRDWLPSKWSVRGRYHFEVYDERFLGPFHEQSIMEIWIPVIKNGTSIA